MTPTETPALDPSKTWVSKAAFTHDRLLTRCRFSPDGTAVVAAGHGGVILRWPLGDEPDEKAAPTVLAGHATWITDLAFDAAGRLYSADYQGHVLAWPAPAGEGESKPLWRIEAAQPGGLRALAVSPDGATLATAGTGPAVRLWSTADGAPLRALEGGRGEVFRLAFHPDGSALVVGDLFGAIAHWEVATGKLVRTLDAGHLHTRKDDFLADVGGVRALAFDATGARLACAGLTNALSNTFCPGEPAALVFDWATGRAAPPLRVAEKADGPLNGVRFLADGTLAAHGEGQNGSALAFWKPGAAEPFHSLRGASAYDLDLHPDGRRLAVAHFAQRGTGGNGRHAKPGEYVSHGGAVRLYHLHAAGTRKT